MSPRKPIKTRRINWEDNEQRALIIWFRQHYPEQFDHAFHVPNGGKRGKVEGAIFKAMGTKAGVPDLLILYPVGKFHGMALELKATPPKDSAVSKPQKEWLERLSSQGYHAVLCKGVVAAKHAIKNYLEGSLDHNG